MHRNIALLIAACVLFVFTMADSQTADSPKDKVLICVAHPDDEFMLNGTIAMLCDNGYPVTVVYATSGEAGLDVSGHGLKGDALARARETEVENALKVLGVKNSPIFLHFKDGHLPETRDQLEDSLTKLFAELKPDVVITFGPDGLTGHHDHIAVCSATSAAFDDQKSCKTLLNFAVSDRRKEDLQKCSNVDYVENFFEGVDNASINFVVDTAKYRQQRIDSFFVHNTQFNQNYRTAWVKFVSDCPYEEYVIARIKGKYSSVNNLGDILARKL